MTQAKEIAQLNKQLQEVLQRLSEAEQRERLLRDGWVAVENALL